MYKMSKTFAVITQESANVGDFADTGFVYEDKTFASLKELADEIRSEGYVEPSDSNISKGTYFSTVDPDLDFESGEETYYTFHCDLNDKEIKDLWKLL